MTSPVIQEVKRKMVYGVLARGVVLAILVGLFWFYFFEQVNVRGETAPIVYGFYGLIGLIFVFNITWYLWRMKKLLGLVRAMQQLAMSYGMEFVTDEKQLTQKYYFRPVECLIRGKRAGKDMIIYPALDISNGRSDKAQSVTVFERPLDRRMIPVSIVKNSRLMSLVGGLMGGPKLLFRNDYLVLSPGVKWAKWFDKGAAKFNSPEEWQNAVLTQVESIFPVDAMSSYDALLGRKTLLVANNSVLLIVNGYVQDLNIFEKYLAFMERLS